MFKCVMEKLTNIIFNFGEEFGTLTKEDIGQLFVDIHASVAPLDPLNKMAMEESSMN